MPAPVTGACRQWQLCSGCPSSGRFICHTRCPSACYVPLHGPIPEDSFVHHDDGNSLNDRLDNLSLKARKEVYWGAGKKLKRKREAEEKEAAAKAAKAANSRMIFLSSDEEEEEEEESSAESSSSEGEDEEVEEEGEDETD